MAVGLFELSSLRVPSLSGVSADLSVATLSTFLPKSSCVLSVTSLLPSRDLFPDFSMVSSLTPFHRAFRDFCGLSVYLPLTFS